MGSGSPGRVKATARVVAELDACGRTRLTAIRSEAPLVLRATPDALYLVGGAGGPLGGDDLSLDIELGPGARLTIRTAAASLAQPGPGPKPSSVRIRARVADGAELQWLPEPVVAVRGCDHRVETTIDVDADGRVVWREELLLGRHDEAPGSVTTLLHVVAGGRPLLRHDLALGPRHAHADGPAIVGDARAVGSVVLVEPAWRVGGPPAGAAAPVAAAARAAVLALDGHGVQIVALAPDAVALRRALDEAVRVVRRRALV